MFLFEFFNHYQRKCLIFFLNIWNMFENVLNYINLTYATFLYINSWLIGYVKQTLIPGQH